MTLRALYTLKFRPKAADAFNKLDKPKREQLAKKLQQRLLNPRVSSAQLRGDLAGLYKIKMKGIRAVYQVKDDEMILLVLVIDKRENDDVYK
ncbi:type II toxin-antitoxin system RelE family toxin [Acetobacter orientalis]|uniref:Plasmid stabilization protein n=1 Tax=Acetobacter orientalis TaxID=146474 RepID=A0A251ZWJ3_9PROT|nr:type II toxin-antitoxin system RelE/ParE family toxin [Acetobacter orientalis]OUI79012.1 hypothetical protein HK12_01425 [Acetobacter orientalis]